jgi:hypothetical protein
LRHRDFRKFLRMLDSRPAAERCCKRRRPQRGTGNGVGPELLDRVAEVAKALEAMSPPPPHEWRFFVVCPSGAALKRSIAMLHL